MGRSANLLGFIATVACALGPSAPAVAGPFVGLPALEPVVLTGSQAPALLGIPVETIWAYRYDAIAARFVQVPVQVDERAPFDLTRGQATPVYELTYDWLGIDDGLLDADDEMAFMARDAGGRAPNTDVWVAGADMTRIEVALADPVSGGTGWIYLFTSAVLVDEDPGGAYVTYSAPDPVSGIANVDAPGYAIGYTGRWRLTALAVKPGPDLLDRIKGRAFSLTGGETEETWEGTSEVGARAGKVRVLREVQGAASGVLTTHLDVFFRDTWRRTTNLRVHPISHIWYYYDFLQPPAPGRFYSSGLLSGFPLDGVNDFVGASTVPNWSQASLPGGTLVMVSKELTPFPLPAPGTACLPYAGTTPYWRDDWLFDDQTGVDGSAFGDPGIHIQCTADTNLSPYSFMVSHYFLPPQGVYTPVGADYAAIETAPIVASPAPQTRPALADCAVNRVEKAGGGRLRFSWIDALGEDSYEIYRGHLARPFAYDHDTALACGVPMQATTWTSPDDEESGRPSYYYLVVPRRGVERRYGTNSAGAPLPSSGSECP